MNYAMLHPGQVVQAVQIGGERPAEVVGVTIVETAMHPWPGQIHTGGDVFEDPEPTPSAVPVPAISRAQAKIQLMRAGYLDQVKVLVEEADVEAKLWFDEASTWYRDNPYVVAIGAELTLSDAAIDQLFRDAALIAA